jgi:hypothetical protein
MLSAVPRSSDLEGSLRRLFEEDGWKISAALRDADFLVSKDGIAYAVELKVAREGRRSVLEALLADAVLRSEAVARRQQSPTRALAIVAAPVLSDSMAVAIREYARAFVAETAFGFFDGRGRAEFHGPGLQGLAGGPIHRPRRSRRPAFYAADLFSDLNQLMLKVLLGRYLPEELLQVRRGRIDGAAQLSKLAGTSLPSAWRFLSVLRDAGFLEESAAGLEIVRREDLMAAWLSAIRRPSLELRATLSIPVREPLPLLESRVSACQSAGMRIAWASFAAAARLGFQFVHGAPLHLYVEDLGEASLSRLNLVRSEDSQPSSVILRKARWPESVFRAAVDRGGQPTADILQCWLDVSQHPARGVEQADVLWRRVLAPALGIDDRRAADGNG